MRMCPVLVQIGHFAWTLAVGYVVLYFRVFFVFSTLKFHFDVRHYYVQSCLHET